MFDKQIINKMQVKLKKKMIKNKSFSRLMAWFGN